MRKEIKCKYCGGQLMFRRVHVKERVSEYYCPYCKNMGFVDEKGNIF